MDYLKEGIGLRALAQRNPLVEFQREGYDMFMAMLDAVREDSLSALFNADVTPKAAAPVASAVPPLRVAEFCFGPAGAADAEGRGVVANR
jgi:preprotein translocase subunit SecA